MTMKKKVKELFLEQKWTQLKKKKNQRDKNWTLEILRNNVCIFKIPNQKVLAPLPLQLGYFQQVPSSELLCMQFTHSNTGIG